MKKNSFYLFLLSFFLINSGLHAQAKLSEKSMRQYPFWIEMMDDTLANFNEVQKAFELFWSDKVVPAEEDEIIGMKGADEHDKEDKSSWLQRLFRRKRSYNEKEMAFAVKKYRHWTLLTEPWVQEDGRILSPSERQRILDNIPR